MYTAEVTGHYRFVQNGLPPPCACQRCVHFDYLGHNHGGGGGGVVQTSRHADHPVLDQARRDGGDLWAKDPTRTMGSSRLERSCHRSPQRRPVFIGTVPCNHTSPVCSYEFAPPRCHCNVRHCPPRREQCRCEHDDAKVFNFGIPHQLPHLQVKGQGYKPCKTVRYASMEDEDYMSDRSSFEPQYSPQMGFAPNGHCGMGTFAFEGVEERDMNREWDRTQPERSEQGCNGHGGFYKGFFSTEVPSKHFNPARRKNGQSVSSTSVTQSLKSNSVIVKKEPETEQTKKDSVREQIRQVVTNLQDVLGGLKQVHVEMREVVEQIDRLTANIDLNDETAGITQGPESNSNCLDFSEDLRVVSLGNHRPQTARHVDEERIILRTNSPSPIHKASVVKTNRIVPSVKQNGLKNGHPPHLYNGNHTGHTILAQESPHPHSLDPKVIIESRTQKPPPYPQNGRCGKYQPQVRPARTPLSNMGRVRESSSMV